MLKKRHKIIIILGLLICFANDIIAQELPTSTDHLIFHKIDEGSYVHVSSITLESGNKYPCNGFLYVNNKEAYLFDSPANTDAVLELLHVLKTENIKLKGVVFNHFHRDCIEGIEIYQSLNIPTIASIKTAQMMSKNHSVLPDITFENMLELNLNTKQIINQFVGEAHSPDNIISYFPEENILFGGCMIKSDGAQKGNLSDANLKEWSSTVERIKNLSQSKNRNSWSRNMGRYWIIRVYNYLV